MFVRLLRELHTEAKNNGEHMKKILKISLAVIFVAALAGTFIFLWRKTRPEKVVYAIVMPQQDTIERRIVATGKVEPRDEVLIKPQISGIISEICKEAGQKVRQGEVIARVKVIPETGELNRAESQVNVAKINLDQTQREHARNQELFDKGVLSKDEYEKSRTALERAQEEMQSAKDNQEIVQNGIASRNSEMSNTQIRSTITGMILDIPVKVGNSVILANTFNEGTTIASVADMSNMLFRGKIDEAEVGKLKEGMPVELTIGALQGVTLDATLEYIAPKGTDENGVIMFEIKAAAQIPEDIFVRAGYSSNADIVIDRRAGVWSVPESIVEMEGDKSYVYLLTSPEDAEEQTFERKEVKIGLSDGVNVEVQEGLTGEEKLRGQREYIKK